MTSRYPVLPSNWAQLVSGWDAGGPLHGYVDLIKKLIGRYECAAFALEDAQRVALLACGSIERDLLDRTRFLAPIVDRAGGYWPLETALNEPSRGWCSHPTIGEVLLAQRAFESELDVLRGLCCLGWSPVRRPRLEGGADWYLERDGESLEIEIRSKAGIEDAPAALFRWLVGVGLLPEHELLRRVHWIGESLPDSETLRRFSLPATLGRAIDLANSERGRLARFLRSDDQRFEVSRNQESFWCERSQNWRRAESNDLIVGWDLRRQSNPPLRMAFTGEESDIEPFYNTVQGRAGYVRAITSDEADVIARLLTSLVCGDESKKRKLLSGNDQLLYVLTWPVPLFTQQAVSTVDVRKILERVKEKVHEVRSARIALWPQPGVSIVLCSDASQLLGVTAGELRVDGVGYPSLPA